MKNGYGGGVRDWKEMRDEEGEGQLKTFVKMAVFLKRICLCAIY